LILCPVKNSKQVMVRMPPFLYEQLKQAADMTMTTPSAMARTLIKQQLGAWDLSSDQEEIPTEEASEEIPPDTSPSSSPGRSSRHAKRRKKKGGR
jgi:hypothetical protein